MNFHDPSDCMLRSIKNYYTCWLNYPHLLRSSFPGLLIERDGGAHIEINVLWSLQRSVWNENHDTRGADRSSMHTQTDNRVLVLLRFGFHGAPSINRLKLSLGNRPHLLAEVPLSPWKQPTVCQAKDASARVHPETLRREDYLSGTPPSSLCFLLFPFMSQLTFLTAYNFC